MDSRTEWAWVKSSFALSIRVLIAGNKNENHILYSPALRERKRGPQPTTDSFSYNDDDDDDGIFNASGFSLFILYFSSSFLSLVHSHFILFYYSFIVHIFCYVCSAHFSCIMEIPYKTHLYKLTICFIFIFLLLHFFRILFYVCIYIIVYVGATWSQQWQIRLQLNLIWLLWMAPRMFLHWAAAAGAAAATMGTEGT